jgi:hypothetical protein
MEGVENSKIRNKQSPVVFFKIIMNFPFVIRALYKKIKTYSIKLERRVKGENNFERKGPVPKETGLDI